MSDGGFFKKKPIINSKLINRLRHEVSSDEEKEYKEGTIEYLLFNSLLAYREAIKVGVLEYKEGSEADESTLSNVSKAFAMLKRSNKLFKQALDVAGISSDKKKKEIEELFLRSCIELIIPEERVNIYNSMKWMLKIGLITDKSFIDFGIFKGILEPIFARFARDESSRTEKEEEAEERSKMTKRFEMLSKELDLTWKEERQNEIKNELNEANKQYEQEKEASNNILRELRKCEERVRNLEGIMTKEKREEEIRQLENEIRELERKKGEVYRDIEITLKEKEFNKYKENGGKGDFSGFLSTRDIETPSLLTSKKEKERMLRRNEAIERKEELSMLLIDLETLEGFEPFKEVYYNMDKEISDLKRKISDLKGGPTFDQAELDQAKKEADELRVQSEEQKKKVEMSRKKADEKKRELDRIQENVSNLKKEIESLSAATTKAPSISTRD